MYIIVYTTDFVCDSESQKAISKDWLMRDCFLHKVGYSSSAITIHLETPAWPMLLRLEF